MTDALMNLLNFDATDLAANRLGRLTEKQLKKLAKDERRRKGCATIGGLGLLLVGLIGVPIAVFYVYNMYELSPGGSIVFGSVFGCIWPLIWGGVGAFILRRAFVKLKVTVQRVEGPVNVIRSIRKSYDSDTHTTSTYTVFELLVGGRIFEVQPGLMGLMAQGDEYAVYFADFQQVEAPQVLSVELLRKGNGYAPIHTIDDPEVVGFLQRGEILQAIKAYRTRHQCTYEEGRAMVEAMRLRLGY
ncbi:MAG TPA: hypothetical protein PK530_22215 [Anaerolineales bacterium]|nr:hypothetical protein [Anaerolineales bacterium]